VLTDHFTLPTVPSVVRHWSAGLVYIQTHHINQTRQSLNTGYCLQLCMMYLPRRLVIVAVKGLNVRIKF
jgi:hypothetical protein